MRPLCSASILIRYKKACFAHFYPSVAFSDSSPFRGAKICSIDLPPLKGEVACRRHDGEVLRNFLYSKKAARIRPDSPQNMPLCCMTP